MRVMVDLNVILDVVQKREPHFNASAGVLAKIRRGDHVGLLPSHSLTTIHYVLTKYGDVSVANQTLDWLLASFDVVPCGKREFLHARGLSMDDYEDAVVASLAVAAKCSVIITRNVSDFTVSPVSAITPEEFLAK